MPETSTEREIKAKLEDRDAEIQRLRGAIRERDKEIVALNRALERAKKQIGNQLVDLPETIGSLSERIGRVEQQLGLTPQSADDGEARSEDT